MARYVAKSSQWVKPTEESGTIQNVGSGIIEVSSEKVENTGIKISSGQMISFSDVVYVRSASNGSCTFTTLPFDALGKGGELFRKGVFHYIQKDEDGSYNTFFAEKNSGGGNQYYNAKTNTLSYVGVNKPNISGADVDVQIYAKDAKSNIGTRLNISSTRGIFYLKNGLNLGFPASREVVVREDIDKISNYSATENEVGRWIDGKALYKKTYRAITPSTQNEFIKLFDIDDTVNTLLDVEVMGTSYMSSLEEVSPIKVVAYDGSIYCKIYGSQQAEKTIYITLRYTK